MPTLQSSASSDNTTTCRQGCDLKRGTWCTKGHMACPVARSPSIPCRIHTTSTRSLPPWLWLGDGTQSTGGYTSADPELVEAWRAGGWDIRKHAGDAYSYGIHGLLPTLRALNVLNNKHIPECYQYAAISERLALLQGLMDTDGWVTKGAGVFSNCTLALAQGVETLARGLGFRTTWREGVAKLYGRVIGPKYDVSVRAHQPLFRLPRKANRLNLNTLERYWSISKIEPVLSVPVKCIVVAAADHLFLAGENCLPTHNSFLALDLAVAVANGEPSWLTFPIHGHGPVIYLQLDTPRGEWAARLEAIATEGRDFGACDILVIVDTLRKAHLGGENESEVMTAVLNQFELACRPAAIVVIHHSRKGNPNPKVAKEDKENPMENIRGTSALSGQMDTVLYLRGKKLIYGGRSIEDGQLSLERLPNHHWRVADSDISAHIREIVATVPGSLRAKARALAARLPDINEDTARTKIARWMERNAKEALQEIETPVSHLVSAS